ncbi:MAG TPA: LCP family protein [Thermoleophilaceae bacterium]|nr:LCP family protein [Thermoleophilaceae bacterium]
MHAGPPGGQEPPEYSVYRSRKRFLDRLRPTDEQAQLRSLRRRKERAPGAPEGPRRRRPLTRGRLLKWVLGAIGAWLLISAISFMASAQLQKGVSDSADAALSGGGSLLTGSTILVLGSDARPPDSKEPGASTTGRADSILLIRAGFGSVKRLSILRDSLAEVPGHGPQKINASYALGGPGLAIRTVEGFLGNGLRINHVIEIDFERFPEFIDALGGIDITLKRCVRSDPFGGRKFNLPRGEHHLNGRQALAFARIRRNRCARNEDDRARARRQQQVLSSIRSRILSPATFLRLPLVSWEAPRTLRTDMRGPGLATLFTDLLTGGAGSTQVLEPSGVGPQGSLTVSEESKAAAVRRLLRD